MKGDQRAIPRRHPAIFGRLFMTLLLCLFEAVCMGETNAPHVVRASIKNQVVVVRRCSAVIVDVIKDVMVLWHLHSYVEIQKVKKL
jgi:hypothetical protein